MISGLSTPRLQIRLLTEWFWVDRSSRKALPSTLDSSSGRTEDLTGKKMNSVVGVAITSNVNVKHKVDIMRPVELN